MGSKCRPNAAHTLTHPGLALAPAHALLDGGWLGRWRREVEGEWMGGLVWSTEGSMQDSPDIHRAGASHLSSLSLRSLLSLLSSYRRFPRRIVHLSIHAARLHRPKRPRCLQAHLTYLVYRKAFLVFLKHLPLPIITNSTRKKQRRTQSLVTRYVRFACAPTPRRGACCVAPASLTPSRLLSLLPFLHLTCLINVEFLLSFSLLSVLAFRFSCVLPSISPSCILSRPDWNSPFYFPVNSLVRCTGSLLPLSPLTRIPNRALQKGPDHGLLPIPRPRPLLLPIIIFSNRLKFWTAA
ncbi:hypothetical protein BKA56DRAFT_303321 [Ilyonectria sp. MPI-CAGE-AT-0026]|nr:hypothetical protein BKA56DRAFT_303321 [Ilyonectria sp. MPI-CAGE-AT-0026]